MESVLAQINHLEEEAGKFPLLSVVLVRQDGGLPGNGFFQFARDRGISVGSSPDAKLAFWAQQINACHRFWGPR